MGYTTDFYGQFDLDKPLTVAQNKTLIDFADERHGGNMQSDKDKPGFYCQWVPNADGTAIEWDGGEKFYEYVEWIRYIITNFIEPWGLKLNGDVEWRGEDGDDMGLLSIKDNVLTVKQGRVTYDG